jgi:hypothetical protein
MGQTPNTPEMAEPMKMVKITVKEYDRLKKFGYAGESINTALQRVLDIAERKERK